MPSTMQHSMVSTRAIIIWPPERLTMALRSLEARPVTVMQPEIMPATPQATATVMEPLQVYEVFRFAAPESSAAEAVMTLNTEPG